jgi:hypothetical protein
MAGPLVIKRLGGTDARRKYHSERQGRRLMKLVGLNVVPVLAGSALARVIVMPRVRTPTLDHVLTEAALHDFAHHVIAASRMSFPEHEASGYYWIDAPGSIRTYPDFVSFLLHESGVETAASGGGLADDERQAGREVLGRAERTPRRLLVLTDIAPKNAILDDGVITHLDLEATLVGPPDFLLVKAAVNLATDCGDRAAAREARLMLLRSCHEPTARACLLFSVLRRIRYDRSVASTDHRPAAALRSILDGAPLEEAVTRLEGSWGRAARV